jgi:hypothetical protein
MQPYEPLSRLDDELSADAAKAALKLCLRFFAAGTVDEFEAVLREINAIWEQQLGLIDPLEHLYQILAAESETRLTVLDSIEQWQQAEGGQGQAVSIEPLRWRVTLKTHEHPREYAEVDAEWDADNLDELTILIVPSHQGEPVRFTTNYDRLLRFRRHKRE